MMQHLKTRPTGERVLFMDGGSPKIEVGDWVYLETLTDEALCVTVEHTDREPPSERYEGRIRYFESELEGANEPLSHLGLEVGQMIAFDEQQIFSCTHQGQYKPYPRAPKTVAKSHKAKPRVL